ncbi:MAG: HIT domain-containing protein [Minisyncoccia bacterium]
MKDCIFCKIIKGELPKVTLCEDKKHIAIMDLNPNTEGVTLVLTKKHFDSDTTDMPDKEYSELMLYVKKVVKMLEKGLHVKRVAIVAEGLGVNHVHIKLYPIHGLEEKFVEMWPKEKIYFDRYDGYISTQLGPELSLEKRQEVADKILKNQ